jgi:hypothetical protein
LNNLLECCPAATKLTRIEEGRPRKIQGFVLLSMLSRQKSRTQELSRGILRFIVLE